MRHNHHAVAVAAIANNVVGFLFHAPFTFLEPWAAGLGVDAAAVAEPSPASFGFGIAGSFAIMYGLSWLLGRVGVDSTRGAVAFCAVLWIGLALPFTLVQYAFAGVGAGAMLVDGFNQLGTLTLGGAIVGGWPSRESRRTSRDVRPLAAEHAR